MKLAVFLLWAAALRAQDPFVVAPEEYHRDFENEYVRIVRVTYPPHGKTAVHTHPALPTVFVYTADGGAMRFSHEGGSDIKRPAVKQGQIRFTAGALETHEVENLSEAPNNYLRLEIKASPVELPERDVRLGPGETFENVMLRIARRPTDPAEYPAVDIYFESGTGVFRSAQDGGNVPDVRVEFKTKPDSPEN